MARALNKIGVKLRRQTTPATGCRNASPGQRATMVAAYQAGATLADAGRAVGMTRRAVLNALRVAKVPVRPKCPDEEDKDAIVALYLAGVIPAEIAPQVGWSQAACYRTLRARGVRLRSYADAARKYTMDHSFFDAIDSEAKAYWLGFITADGCVVRNCLTVALHEQDRRHLEKMREALASDVAIYEYDYVTVKGHHRTRVTVTFTSAQLVAGLARAGVGPRKSLVVKPWQGPSSLMRHYWRGVFDGDGSLSIGKRKSWRISLTGNRFMVAGFRQFVTQRIALALCPKISDFETYQQVAWASFPVVCRIATLLFDGAGSYLDRKQAKVQQLLAHRPSDRRIRRAQPCGRNACG